MCTTDSFETLFPHTVRGLRQQRQQGAPLPNAPVTAAKQEQRRRDAAPTGRQLGTILTGSTRAGDKKALLGQ